MVLNGQHEKRCLAHTGMWLPRRQEGSHPSGTLLTVGGGGAGKEALGRVQNCKERSTRLYRLQTCVKDPCSTPSHLPKEVPSLCLQQHRDPERGAPAGPGHCSPFSSPCLAHWASVRVETLLSSKLIFKTTIMSTVSPGLGKSSRAEVEGRKPRLVTGPALLQGPYGGKTGREDGPAQGRSASNRGTH